MCACTCTCNMIQKKNSTDFIDGILIVKIISLTYIMIIIFSQKQLKHIISLPFCRIFRCLSKKSFSFLLNSPHPKQCLTGSIKHILCSSSLFSQQALQKHFPHLLQWCCKYMYIFTIKMFFLQCLTGIKPHSIQSIKPLLSFLSFLQQIYASGLMHIWIHRLIHVPLYDFI